MNQTKRSIYIYLLPLTAVVIWSINMVVTKLAAQTISAISISFYRWVLAFILLTPFVLSRVLQQWQIVKPLLPKLTVLGFLGMLMYQGLAYEAAHTTTATNMGILNALIPTFTLALAAVLLGEKPGLLAIVGGMVSWIGIMILIGHGNPVNVLHGDFHIGDLLMLLAVIGYAMYGVLNRLWQIPLDLLSNIYLQIGFGMLLHIPFVLAQGLSSINATNVWLVLYAGTLPSLIAPLVWVKAIHVLGPSRTSIFLNLIPILAAVLAIVCLGEQWHLFHTVGGLLTVGGVILAQYKPAPKVSMQA